MAFFVERMETSNLTLATMSMRNLWLRRNEAVFRNKFRAPHLILEAAKGELSDYLLAYDTSLQNTIAIIRALVRWSSPASRKVKLNWNATVRAMTKCMAIDMLGKFLACLSASCPYYSHPVIAQC